MSDQDEQGTQESGTSPEAKVRMTRFSIIWLIPVVAVGIAAWLGWHSWVNRGPLITVTFDTAAGLTSGQTAVKHKAVTLGTVTDLTLSSDMRRVVVHIRMNANAQKLLNDGTRFWVVRPRINGASITGLETLFTGAYISIDPGPDKAGHTKRDYVGLESAPGLRSDQPGTTYMLVTPTIGSIGEGAPVYFRDMQVGEVLGYTMPPGGEGPIVVQLFVKAPYDHYLRTDTRFWNVSGVDVKLGAGGLKLQMTSLQALFSGGVAFGLPAERRKIPALNAPPNTVFKLYGSEAEADNARYRQHMHVVTYLDSSAAGLAQSGLVTMYGMRVGTVNDVRLQIDPVTANARVRVEMDLEAERLHLQNVSQVELLRQFVAKGMRASVESASFLTGESLVAFEFVKNAKPVPLTFENGLPVIPSKAGGFDGIMASASTIMDKVAAMPLTQIGEHLDGLLAHADARINSPEVTQSLRSLRDSLHHMSDLMAHADDGTKPLFKKLPAMADALQGTLDNANKVLAGYRGDTDFGHDLKNMVLQLGEAARSLRLMMDYLNRHPSSLITGRH